MVNVIKPEGYWTVKITLNNEGCPYLCYPGNYHGCRHEKRYTLGCNIPDCDGDLCPCRVKDKPKKEAV